MNTPDLLSQHYFFHNSLSTWLESLVIAAVFITSALALRSFLLARMRSLQKRDPNGLAPLGVTFFRRTRKTFIVSIGILIACHYIVLPETLLLWLDRIIALILILQFGTWGSVSIHELLAHALRRKTSADGSTQTAFLMIEFALRLILFSLLFLIFLNNLGINITALLAGLGVGGIAVALAVQKILGDLLSSLTIVLDKPFSVGDYLIVGDLAGRVTKVGIRTTRLLGDSGEEIIYSNADLIQSRIRNLERMEERTVQFQFTTPSDLKSSQVQEICNFIEWLISQDPVLKFERAHLISIHEPAFKFEVVFKVKDPQKKVFLDHQQTLFIALLNFLEERGIELSRPPVQLAVAPAPPPKLV